MEIKRQVVVFDAADIDTESAFWAGVLGGTVDADEDWHSVIDAEGNWVMGIQLAPDHVQPDWPDGEEQQVHLDLWVDDIDVAHEHVMSLGARLLRADEGGDEPDAFQVYADPAGHPFCLCWTRADQSSVTAS